MLYIVQRMDCGRFAIASDIDPAYDEALEAALKAGVEAFCYQCEITRERIEVTDPLPIERRQSLAAI